MVDVIERLEISEDGVAIMVEPLAMKTADPDVVEPLEIMKTRRQQRRVAALLQRTGRQLFVTPVSISSIRCPVRHLK